MQFSLNNTNIFENDFTKCIQQSKSQENGILQRKSSQITSPSSISSDSSLNQSPFIDLEPIDLSSFPIDTLMTPQTKVTNNENQIQDIMEMVLTGNKNKIQNKKDFIDTIQNISPDNFIDYLKEMGEKMFDDKTITTTATNQLTSPITTPLDNTLLDLNVNLFNSPVNSTISSPEVISPIQQNTLENSISNTPIVNNVYTEPLIIVQDELNPFKSPAQIVPSPMVPSPNVSLLTPAPMMQSPLVTSMQSPLFTSLMTTTPIQQTIQSPLISTPVQPNTIPDLSNILDTISQQSSIVSTNDSLLMPSPVIQNPSPVTTPVIPNEPIHEDNNSLEKVDIIMKAVNNFIQNKENTQASTSLSTSTNDSDVYFPSTETIKQCIVNKYNFDFSVDNINKLVRLAPVEYVQEDVIELKKLAHQKRGKGRPRKPRKFTICPFANCHKKFNREYNLKEHIRIHNPKRNKDYVCHICDEGFFSSSVLSRHMSAAHQGEKFPCKYCGRKFNRRDALHRHKKVSCS